MISRIRSFLGKGKAKAKAKAAPKCEAKPGSLKQARLANKHTIMAFDHSIQAGLGIIGLLGFAAPKVLAPMPKGIERFYVDVSKLTRVY